jgi:hypothetical protein
METLFVSGLRTESMEVVVVMKDENTGEKNGRYATRGSGSRLGT